MTKKKILVFDFGDYLEHAIRLGRAGHEVLYYCPWESAFPNSNKMMVGKDMEYITKVMSFWKYVDEVDLVVSFCNNNSDIIEYLRKTGKPVFGAGRSEMIELDRWLLKRTLEKVGLPFAKSEKITGLPKLIEYLKPLKNKFIKASFIRGDMETHHYDDFESSQPWLDDLAVKLGARKEHIDFIVEDPIEGVEIGYDGYTIDGQYAKTAFFGYEYKDRGYIGKVIKYDDMHPSVKKVNEKLAPLFKKWNARTLYSTEVRVTDKGVGYLIDPCMRGGLPPSEIELELYENFDEIIIGGAEGKLVEPKPTEKYGAQIFFNSDWAEDNQWLKISIPKEIRKWVKLMGACKINDEYYIIPEVFGKYIGTCSVVAIGNSPQECFDLIKKRIEMVKAYQLDKTFDIEHLTEYLKRGEHLGIKL
jgi:hypothetical protein